MDHQTPRHPASNSVTAPPIQIWGGIPKYDESVVEKHGSFGWHLEQAETPEYVGALEGVYALLVLFAPEQSREISPRTRGWYALRYLYENQHEDVSDVLLPEHEAGLKRDAEGSKARTMRRSSL